MDELVRTGDPVLVSFIEALLSEAGIRCLVADVNIGITEGSIGIFPRRVLVPSDDLARARRLLEDAGLTAELPEVPRR